jgi:hypothetical protein
LPEAIRLEAVAVHCVGADLMVEADVLHLSGGHLSGGHLSGGHLSGGHPGGES